MTPGYLDITIYQGATFKRIIRLKDSANVAIDLTGGAARMQIRRVITDATPLIELAAANGRATIADAANGEVSLLIAAEDTSALDFERGVYDLEIEYSDGTVDRVLEGKVRLSKEVTR